MKSFDLKKQIARMGRNRLVPILAALLWTGSFAFAQNVVRGTVTDENGEPLPGVSVVVKEGGKAVTGVMTDMSGQYSLSVPAGAELEFSFVGFQTQTFPAGQVPGSLTLATDILQESVVIGYGTVKKKDVLGSISTVREQDLVNRKTGNVVESMQGMTSGVKITSSGQPGCGSAIQIRGIGSFTGNSPLFIVDGSYGGSELGLNVVFITMQPGADRAESELIASLMKEKAYILPSGLDATELMSVIGRAELTLSMRLHSLIFAARMAVPTVGFSYDPKLDAYLELLDQPLAGSVEALDVEEAFATVKSVVEQRAVKVETLAKKRDELTALAAENEKAFRALYE